MSNKFICPSCERETETCVIEKKETLSIKGKSFTLMVKVRICNHCKEELVDEKLDQETLLAFYDAYRKSENLLTSSEIRDIRLSYNLSQASFARFLGFGEKTITRYENGAIQDVCHDNLLRLLKSPSVFFQLWSVRKDSLSETENKKLSQLPAFSCYNYFFTPPYHYEKSVSFINNENGGIAL